ncbi:MULTISPECIES: hypothetical protein [Streptomycetaceae]|uniref:hypothetical protein n=1 Tax=Streptomycetaceae TaxID=2062 RepID=UPI0009395C0D|nr:hypothetical protein [Streptomyces sp. CB02056]OKI08809.1 hypothetical protein AMK13_10435 [Streptomyces sp. CB02056]
MSTTTTAHLDLTTGVVTADPEPAPFSEVLREHMGGRVHDAASAELYQLLNSVARHGKKGTLQLVVLVEPPRGHVEGGPLSVAMSTVLRAPKGETPASTYYLDSSGNPSRQDPRQPGLWDDVPVEARQAGLRATLARAGVDPDEAADLAAALDAEGYRRP